MHSVVRAPGLDAVNHRFPGLGRGRARIRDGREVSGKY